MAKAVKSEEATGDVVASKAKYWSPDNENLILDGNPQIKFEGFVVEVETPEIIKRMESSPWKGKDFYRVYDKAGDEKYKARLMGKIRGMVMDDPSDQVKQERGLLALTALFSQSELDEYGISRSYPDIDALVLIVINKKYVEGI
jgi:hypothetical protein